MALSVFEVVESSETVMKEWEYTVHALKKLTFYGRTTPTATGVLRLRLRTYYAHGYGRSSLTATGVRRLRLQAFYAYSYRRTWSKATGVLCLQLRAYRGYNYRRATGVLCGRV